MSDRGDAQFFQVVAGELRQHVRVDAVLSEGLRVLRQSQAGQPVTYVHRAPLKRIATA